MAPSLQQWESDPLFSAAEVVQDSADRMESIFRLLMHELSLVQGDHSDPKLLTSIDFHRRDLVTILETTKWQLEDFQRAVSLSATTEKSQMKEDVSSRHRQFIRAIREQIVHVEKSLKDSSVSNPVRDNEWVNLNEEDRYGFAMFLSGGSPSEQLGFNDVGDNGILKRYLESTMTTSGKDGTLRDADHKSIELETLNGNGVLHMDHNEISSLPETSHNRFGDGSWDLEANEAEPKSVFHENKSRRFCGRRNVFVWFNNIWAAYGSRVARNYAKRLKDGEEQRDSPLATDTSNDALVQDIDVVVYVIMLYKFFQVFDKCCILAELAGDM
ncbi:hypothetical protein TIFTF001_008711 [Ficus carica]|uniref:Syntaxin 6/10/61 N-terminal domain-containing protein n=1 Tax=Ficus carica TaxID=3494 RepID=A0AA88CY90_FICCA|nr:hypothetical protein TIFTF001_008711 [Ficus carica]